MVQRAVVLIRVDLADSDSGYEFESGPKLDEKVGQNCV
ncbi:hypothetical protein OROGR_026598 [Orobanche gracilis]